MHVIDNKKENRFETVIDGHKAIIEYTVQPDTLTIIHTEVDKELSGKGIAGQLTESVLMDIERRGLKVIPECPYTKRYIDKHPEWKSLLAE